MPSFQVSERREPDLTSSSDPWYENQNHSSDDPMIRWTRKRHHEAQTKKLKFLRCQSSSSNFGNLLTLLQNGLRWLAWFEKSQGGVRQTKRVPIRTTASARVLCPHPERVLRHRIHIVPVGSMRVARPLGRQEHISLKAPRTCTRMNAIVGMELALARTSHIVHAKPVIESMRDCECWIPCPFTIHLAPWDLASPQGQTRGEQ